MTGLGLATILLAGCVRPVPLREGAQFGIYQTRGANVYLASAFVDALSGRMSEAESKAYYGRIKCEIGILLERGVLTGRMFFDAVGTSSPAPAVISLIRRELQDVDQILAADKGPLVKILYYQDTSDTQAPTRRKFDLWVTFFAWEDGAGSFDHLLLELENRRATLRTSACDFSKAARVLKLEYAGTEI